jgi:hypothetical protein
MFLKYDGFNKNYRNNILQHFIPFYTILQFLKVIHTVHVLDIFKKLYKSIPDQ